VRDWITKVVTEVVANYPIDGVQFDDYFMPNRRDPRSMIRRPGGSTARVCLKSRLAKTQHAAADCPGFPRDQTDKARR
jgi:uncharacterized lipoprotein YddW (UPF0748 family)